VSTQGGHIKNPRAHKIKKDGGTKAKSHQKGFRMRMPKGKMTKVDQRRGGQSLKKRAQRIVYRIKKSEEWQKGGRGG